MNNILIEQEKEREIEREKEERQRQRQQQQQLQQQQQEQKEQKENNQIINFDGDNLINPYLSINSSSSAATSYIQQLKDEALNNANDFAKISEAKKWSCQEVAYWLITIQCQKYIPQFLESFIDGNMLLTDINKQNLISDLSVKNIHSGKMMREIAKLKKYYNHNNKSQLSASYNIFQHNIMPQNVLQELKIQNDSLKNDLSSTRLRVQELQRQIDESQNERERQRSNTLHTPQSSLYGMNGMNDDNQSDKSGSTAYSLHLRQTSSKSAYSEGDAKSQLHEMREKSPTPPLPSDEEKLPSKWKKYVSHLEAKNKELSMLFLRADHNLKKYSKAIIPFKERIEHLELQNKSRKKQIDKLNKRIERRNEKIKQLTINNSSADSNIGSISPKSTASNENNIIFNHMNNNHLNNNQLNNNQNQNHHHMLNQHNHQYSLTPQQEQFFKQSQMNYSTMQQQHVQQQQYGHQYSSSSHLLEQKKRRRKNKNSKYRQTVMRLRNDSNTSRPHITGYVSGGSVQSTQSAPPSSKNDDDDTVIGTLSKWASTYWYSGTPGNL